MDGKVHLHNTAPKLCSQSSRFSWPIRLWWTVLRLDRRHHLDIHRHRLAFPGVLNECRWIDKTVVKIFQFTQRSIAEALAFDHISHCRLPISKNFRKHIRTTRRLLGVAYTLVNISTSRCQLGSALRALSLALKLEGSSSRRKLKGWKSLKTWMPWFSTTNRKPHFQSHGPFFRVLGLTLTKCSSLLDGGLNLHSWRCKPPELKYFCRLVPISGDIWNSAIDRRRKLQYWRYASPTFQAYSWVNSWSYHWNVAYHESLQGRLILNVCRFPRKDGQIP